MEHPCNGRDNWLLSRYFVTDAPGIILRAPQVNESEIQRAMFAGVAANAQAPRVMRREPRGIDIDSLKGVLMCNQGLHNHRNSKSQITIPAIVRTALGVKAGDRVEFVQVGPGRFELVAATQSVTALNGLVRKPASPVKMAAMNDAIAAHGAKAR